ncbi:DNA polymerase III subunit beta [Helicobacter cetorum]|uniref:Beta sliding clamp n=1 Tax=Helicobacter cetorum (strain ATCC BAA-429 / MIT 00-7128) TaxID=182217 RepID=I0EM79_HELC0|nr:DNA polymerase III subunit beta [Helicobacter cetorum]AFI04048.1 DNA polymerase III subunit beta [Helicobacter cetorum MIT 00-7128]
MKISANKNDLEIALRSLQAFLDKKDASSITSHIHLEAINDQLFLKASDSDMGLKSHILVQSVEDEGMGTINGKKFLDIISRLKDASLILETKEDVLIIKQNKSSFKLPMFDASEFPEFPSIEPKVSMNISTPLLVDAFKKIAPVIEQNSHKKELAGALMQFDKANQTLALVGTDTRRLSYTQLEQNAIESQEQTFSCILPKRALLESLKLFYEDFSFKSDGIVAIIENSTHTFFTKLIDGNYPDYQKILPKEYTSSFTLDKEEFKESIKLSSSLSANIKLTLESNSVLFESLDSEHSETASTSIELENALDLENTFSLGVNAKFFLEALNALGTAHFTLHCNESSAPFLLQEPLDEKQSHLSAKISTLMMPITL